MTSDNLDLPVFPTDLGEGVGPRRRLVASASPPLPDESGRMVHRILAGTLIAIIAIAPIPLGSNRPAFWAAWGVVLGLLAIAYGATLMVGRVDARMTLRQLWPEAACLALLVLYLIVQVLPLDRWLPAGWMVQPPLGQHLRTLSADPGSTWLTALQFVTFGLLFMLFAAVAVNRRRARRMLFSIMIIVGAFAIIGIVSLTQGDTLLGFMKTDYLGYATGTFVNRNSYATFLASGLVIGTAILVGQFQPQPGRPQPLRQRVVPLVVTIACLLVIAPTLLATGSRMGTVSGLIGVIAVLLLSIRPSRLSGPRAALVVGLVAVAAIVALVLFGMPLVERLVLTPAVDESRVALHAQIWEQIWQRPWLGYGGGSFASINATFVRPPLSGALAWDRTHSTYLALWFEQGLIAGSLPLLIVVLLVIRTATGLGNPSSAGISAATLGVVIVFAVHSLLDFSAEIMANAFLLTGMLALGAAAQGSHRTSGGP